MKYEPLCIINHSTISIAAKNGVENKYTLLTRRVIIVFSILFFSILFYSILFFFSVCKFLYFVHIKSTSVLSKCCWGCERHSWWFKATCWRYDHVFLQIFIFNDCRYSLVISMYRVCQLDMLHFEVPDG